MNDSLPQLKLYSQNLLNERKIKSVCGSPQSISYWSKEASFISIYLNSDKSRYICLEKNFCHIIWCWCLVCKVAGKGKKNLCGFKSEYHMLCVQKYLKIYYSRLYVKTQSIIRFRKTCPHTVRPVCFLRWCSYNI